MSSGEKEQVVLSPSDLKSELVSNNKLDSVISNIAPQVSSEQAIELKGAIVDAASQSVKGAGISLNQAVQRDPWLLRVVLAGLSATLLACLGGGIWLQGRGGQIPQILVAWGTGSVTLLHFRYRGKCRLPKSLDLETSIVVLEFFPTTAVYSQEHAQPDFEQYKSMSIPRFLENFTRKRQQPKRIHFLAKPHIFSCHGSVY